MSEAASILPVTIAVAAPSAAASSVGAGPAGKGSGFAGLLSQLGLGSAGEGHMPNGSSAADAGDPAASSLVGPTPLAEAPVVAMTGVAPTGPALADPAPGLDGPTTLTLGIADPSLGDSTQTTPGGSTDVDGSSGPARAGPRLLRQAPASGGKPRSTLVAVAFAGQDGTAAQLPQSAAMPAAPVPHHLNPQSANPTGAMLADPAAAMPAPAQAVADAASVAQVAQSASDAVPQGNPSCAANDAVAAIPPSVQGAGTVRLPRGGMTQHAAQAASDVPADSDDAASATSNQVAAPALPAAPDPASNPSPQLPPASVAATAHPAAPAATRAASSLSDQATDANAPSHQVASALMAVARAPDGSQRLTLRLQPVELGQVEIRIDRSVDAPARVDISVQRADTMTLLLRDQPQLQQALDQAGVPAEGRSLTLHMANVDTGGTPFGTASDPGTHQGGNGRSGSTANGSDAGSTPAEEAMPPRMHRWLRAGLDITA